VHIEARPAILVQDGRFFPPPVEWQILEGVRDEIELTFKSVGRIELTGHSGYDWVGTGFLVAENVIMTNRHVAQIFCKRGCLGRWDFAPEVTAHIDYVEELGSLASAEYALTSVIGVHNDFDLALFTVEPISSTGSNLPEPLSVSARPPSDLVGQTVYCVGYPAWDGRRNDPEVMRKIFSNIFNVKRLQPGKTMSYQAAQKLFKHDCSTLGGNSGSSVIDLETNQVIGLHFSGRYLQGNSAVALWELTNDRLLKKGKVQFIS
jgi:S1-C subfamily serine protease